MPSYSLSTSQKRQPLKQILAYAYALKVDARKPNLFARLATSHISTSPRRPSHTRAAKKWRNHFAVFNCCSRLSETDVIQCHSYSKTLNVPCTQTKTLSLYHVSSFFGCQISFKLGYVHSNE